MRKAIALFSVALAGMPVYAFADSTVHPAFKDLQMAAPNGGAGQGTPGIGNAGPTDVPPNETTISEPAAAQKVSATVKHLNKSIQVRVGDEITVSLRGSQRMSYKITGATPKNLEDLHIRVHIPRFSDLKAYKATKPGKAVIEVTGMPGCAPSPLPCGGLTPFHYRITLDVGAMRLTNKDNNKRIAVKQGATIQVRLNTTAPGWTDWQITNQNPKILKEQSIIVTAIGGVTVKQYEAIDSGVAELSAQSFPRCDLPGPCALGFDGFKVTLVVDKN